MNYTLYQVSADGKAFTAILVNATRNACGKLMDRLNKRPGGDRTKCALFDSGGRYVSGTACPSAQNKNPATVLVCGVFVCSQNTRRCCASSAFAAAGIAPGVSR